MHWKRKSPSRWLVGCRDVASRRRQVVVAPVEDLRHIALIGPAGDVAVLDLLAAGQLRAALRDVAYALDDPSTAFDHVHRIPLGKAG